MDALNIVLVIIIGYILYLLTFNQGGKVKYIDKISKKENFSTNMSDKKRQQLVNQIIDDVVSWDDSADSIVVKKEQLNPNFINTQFHNDYRDVITALNNLVPDRKQLFNLANIPLVYSEPEVGAVKSLVKDFLTVLNKNLIAEVPKYRNPNSGWDEAIPDPNMESGWQKIQRSLGLAPSLYHDPNMSKVPLKLIAINDVQKYETDDEIKYSMQMVIQKFGVNDQMIIKPSFVQDKRPLNDENNFFVTHTVDMKVTIEELFVVGYLSKEGNDARLQFDRDMDKYYDYNALEINNLTDPKYIQRVLMEKYRQRSTETELRTAMLDEEGQAFHKTLPSVYDFSNIRDTQTIYDDMNYHKNFI